MPLTFANIGAKVTVQRIKDKDEVRKHLEQLGFVQGSVLVVVAKTGGNIIVNVKGARIGISQKMANRIMIA